MTTSTPTPCDLPTVRDSNGMRSPCRAGWAAQVSLIFALALAVSGCAMTGPVAVRPEFRTYKKIAIFPQLSRTQEELFIPLYMAAFPDQTLVERRDLLPILGEQDMLPERMNDETRAKIRRIFGVEIIVYPSYTAGCPSQLAVKAIDTETGAIVAAIVVSDNNTQPGRGLPDRVLIRPAIGGLKAEAAKTRA